MTEMMSDVMHSYSHITIGNDETDAHPHLTMHTYRDAIVTERGHIQRSTEVLYPLHAIIAGGVAAARDDACNLHDVNHTASQLHTHACKPRRICAGRGCLARVP